MANRVLVAVLMVVAASACGGSSGSPGPSAIASVAATASPEAAPPRLDPAVPVPVGFPSDVPIYPGARLTAGAGFAGSGQTTWGMEWETLDGLDRVRAFYAAKLSEGDWTIQFSGSAGSSFSAVFTRRSNSKATGILGADGSSGLTKIALSLVNS